MRTSRSVIANRRMWPEAVQQQLRPIYENDAAAMIAASHVIAMRFSNNRRHQ
ncbi:hexameric tyrosine-coordinated heme protein [Leptospira interrogans]